MNILTSYTLRCLKQNRIRTLVTVIGIILSVALFTAVSEGAYSGQQYMVNVIKENVGSFHAFGDELRADAVEALRSEQGVQRVETLDCVGFAMLGDSASDKPFLTIGSMSDGFSELVSVRILKGRMPENPQELLISDLAAATMGVSFEVGQTLTLHVGERVRADGAGKPLEERILGIEVSYLHEEELLTDVQERIYTVVGVYDQFRYELQFHPTGTLALTTGATGRNYKAFYTLDDPSEIFAFRESHEDLGGDVNEDLLLFNGVSEDGTMLTVFSSLIVILFGLISFGSIALVYNAFSISVSERTRQFGLLKSIGATNRQMRRAVLIEALLLSLIAIPIGLLVGCGGIGLTLRLLQSTFDRLLPIDGADSVPIRLVWNLPALALAAGIGLLTTLISAWIPARQATRLSPIAAIRQSRDVRIRAKKIRVSKLTSKLFGFPGTLATKNYKRSRKQYRATVVSLFLSIVLFVSAFSFSAYLRENVGSAIEQPPADLHLEFFRPGQLPETLYGEKLLDRLLEIPSVSDGVYALSFSGSASDFPEAAISEDLRDRVTVADIQRAAFHVSYVPDDFYAELCAQAGVDPASGQAVAYVSGTLAVDTGVGFQRVHFTLFDQTVLPMPLTVVSERDFDELILVVQETDEAGSITRCGYYPAKELGEDDAYDPAKVIYYAPEEVMLRQTITVGGLLDQMPLAYENGKLTLYLPYSSLPEADDAYFQLDYYLKAQAHREASLAILEVLGRLIGTAGLSYAVFDDRGDHESIQALLLVLNVFTFGFVVLISLIAAANVFNTISTNIALRRREFAALKSTGMGDKAFGKMMRFECLLYGTKALLWGIPASFAISWLWFFEISQGFQNGRFRLHWSAIGIAVCGVFLVVFVSMLFATHKLRKQNPIEVLKTETL